MTAAEARRRFAAARIARLATLGADRRPHLVPIVFALAGDTVYSVVDGKPKRTVELARLRNVSSQPRASVLVDHYEEDWDALWWVRGDGLARVLDRADAEAESAVRALVERYPQQRATGAVLALDVERWSGWAAAERRRA